MVRVDLAKEMETLLGPLYGRALDARARRPVLGDAMADQTVRSIDYPFEQLKITPALAPSIAARAKHFDDWAREFIADSPDATVLHLAAGLDARVWRVDPPTGVTWFDIDHPEVIDLRRALLPTRDNYHLVGADLTTTDWLGAVPAHGPTLVLAEGLTMYLEPRAGHDLFRRVVDHCGHGTLAFDAFNSMGNRMQQRHGGLRRTGALLRWGIDDPHELERADPRLRLTDSLSALYAPGAHRIALRFRIMAVLVSPFPPVRNIGRYLRYTF